MPVDALLEQLLEIDRSQSALHGRAARILAELGRRSTPVGAEHVTPEARVQRGNTDAGSREAAAREHLGARLIVAEIAVARRMSESSIRTQLDESTRLARLPSVLAALDEGRLSPAHARALADGVIEIPAGAEAEFEELVLPAALHGTPAQIRRRTRAVRERLHPVSIDIRAARRRQERRIAFEPDRDGMAWLHLHLTCADARGAYERIDAAARSLATMSGEHRGVGQIRADVAAELLLYGDVCLDDGVDLDRVVDLNGGVQADRSRAPSDASATGAKAAMGNLARAISGRDTSLRGLQRRRGRYAGFRPTVRVTVPVLTLLGESEEPASLEGYGPIQVAMAEELAAAAPSFTRILTHPETGTMLSVGRASYAVPADLRRFVHLRDVRCRFPGCERSAARCDIDHTRAWEHGGETAHDNLACLCRTHHRLKHETTWQVSRPPGGVVNLVWRSPFGRTVIDSPDPPF